MRKTDWENDNRYQAAWEKSLRQMETTLTPELVNEYAAGDWITMETGCEGTYVIQNEAFPGIWKTPGIPLNELDDKHPDVCKHVPGDLFTKARDLNMSFFPRQENRPHLLCLITQEHLERLRDLFPSLGKCEMQEGETGMNCIADGVIPSNEAVVAAIAIDMIEKPDLWHFETHLKRGAFAYQAETSGRFNVSRTLHGDNLEPGTEAFVFRKNQQDGGPPTFFVVKGDYFSMFFNWTKVTVMGQRSVECNFDTVHTLRESRVKVEKEVTLKVAEWH
jgi:hypothetical protein